MKKIYLHPLPVRLWHWTNALGFLALILSGLQIRYLGLFDLMSFRSAVRLHNAVGLVLIANFMIWLTFYLFTDKIRVYHPELNPVKHFVGSLKQVKYYAFGIFRGDPNPFHVTPYSKFNPLQAMTYQLIMLLLVPLQFFTGVLLWDAQRFSGAIDLLGGIRIVDTVHVLLFIFFCCYVIVHVYLGTLGHTRTAHFKEMLTGYEDATHEEIGGAEASPTP